MQSNNTTVASPIIYYRYFISQDFEKETTVEEVPFAKKVLFCKKCCRSVTILPNKNGDIYIISDEDADDTSSSSDKENLPPINERINAMFPDVNLNIRGDVTLVSREKLPIIVYTKATTIENSNSNNSKRKRKVSDK